MAKAKTIIVEQTASTIGRPKNQAQILRGLGLSRPGRRRELQDTPEIRGMINKIGHLVRIVDNA